MLDGELTFQLGDEVFTRRAGETRSLRAASHHTFANHSDAEARTLIVCTPAGFERYFARMAAEQAASIRPSGRWAMPSVTTAGPQIEAPS